jgi:TolA-binding protein
MGETKQAIKEFAELVEKYKDEPVTPEVQFRIGEFFFNQKEYPEAQRQFDVLQKKYPQSAYADAALYWAGRSAFGRQGYNEAAQYFQKLLDNYPLSAWRADARFWQGDTLIEQGGKNAYGNALLVFDQLIREFKGSDLVDEAWGRYADCQFTLQRYYEAIPSYQNVVNSGSANVSQKNHAHYQIAVCYEKLNRPSDAFDQYMEIVYDRVTAEPKPVTESFWFCKAGMAAAAIKKQQDQWREAMKIYQRLIEANVVCSQEAQEQIRIISESKMVPVLGQ